MRRALAAAMREAGMTVAAACSSGEEALATSGDRPIGVAIVELELPGISGAETIRRLRAARPGLPALVLSVVEHPAEVVAAFAAGATGYLLKGTPIAEIVSAVNQVRAGLAPISPAVARHIIAALYGREPADARAGTTEGRDRLTPREHEILSLLVGGHSYAAVGSGLAISLSTVQTHVKNIYRKLDVSSKAEAVRVALTEGILSRARG